ncbi:hypothetical protein HZH68_007391 [Vespula germanica]|uniref:Uncharacterized protein n=1 Tax=Vespula germanica TaxID=30212 RepID=A0A834K7J5_VESGE|nr:hypothetical protein HZH68_007391 [Vespula germanica]
MESEIRGEFQWASGVFVPGKPFSVKGGRGGGRDEKSGGKERVWGIAWLCIHHHEPRNDSGRNSSGEPE